MMSEQCVTEMRRGGASGRCLLCLETLSEPVGGFRGVLRLSVCLFVGGIYAGVYMRLSVCLFVSGMYVELDLVATARLCRVSHKMRITTEDGDLWVNKACKSGRIATAIKDNNNSVLYMYIGGGAVDHCL